MVFMTLTLIDKCRIFITSIAQNFRLHAFASLQHPLSANNTYKYMTLAYTHAINHAAPVCVYICVYLLQGNVNISRLLGLEAFK